MTKQSLTYYLTLLVIKLKGIKKLFSEYPINFKKIRKEDVQHPKGKFFRRKIIRKFTVERSAITEIRKQTDAHSLILFIHGGAFISGPAQHHWDTIKEILKHTNHTLWLCNYPKAPEHKILEISENIDKVYDMALTKYPSTQIQIIGDSVGGTLIAALIQRLVKKGIELPSKIILISPVMDASMSNPEIDEIDEIDPMLSKVGLLSAKKMCAVNADLTDESISPIYGDFSLFPKTFLFLATNDITYPDQKLLVEKLEDADVDFEVELGNNMPHIWPLLPVMKEARTALRAIIKELNKY